MSEVVFRELRLGQRATVRVGANAVSYERRRANWLTWLLVFFTGGVALLAWPWIKFGRVSSTIPRSRIDSVQIEKGAAFTTLVLLSSTGRIAFRTDKQTAEQARSIILA
ncbi:hypothetical protein [uncultured Aeromicrobium sp.]|uniref:hypothetical protein n=1 Tax=uncultured Aeromicrobium sp. TaxID=337820 RepID=UPI0025E8EA35|nr:hypothetical protein [uncultured Aeromicrobium sp.]